MGLKDSYISRLFSLLSSLACRSGVLASAVSCPAQTQEGLTSHMQLIMLLGQTFRAALSHQVYWTELPASTVWCFLTSRKASRQQMVHLVIAPSSHQQEKETWDTPSSGLAISLFLWSTRASMADSSTCAFLLRSLVGSDTRQKLCLPRCRHSHL